MTSHLTPEEMKAFVRRHFEDFVNNKNATVEEVKKIMDEDPGVKAGVFVYEIHACRSFPGDSLPM